MQKRPPCKLAVMCVMLCPVLPCSCKPWRLLASRVMRVLCPQRWPKSWAFRTGTSSMYSRWGFAAFIHPSPRFLLSLLCHTHPNAVGALLLTVWAKRVWSRWPMPVFVSIAPPATWHSPAPWLLQRSNTNAWAQASQYAVHVLCCALIECVPPPPTVSTPQRCLRRVP
jgi:hypothetical protein